TFGYDVLGRLATIEDARTRTLTYDARGRLDRIVTSDGVSQIYGWDGSLLSSVTVAGPFSHRIDQTYDNFFRPLVTTIDGGSPVAQAYDLDGVVSSVGGLAVTRGTTGLVKSTTASSITDAFTYNPYGEIIGHAVTG
ncbi:RHS repeat domain-containing protein, partial [Bradyrhizobium sp. NBAIM08]|uniref:RHS repeat domain-containing protein n=1 Tax=Bradyrhizobium sp. NBAIM08 TaxID=2793815 RepID=UPI001CD4C15D